MRILAIETSCDETSFAVVSIKEQAKFPLVTVEKNIVASQIALHAPFGGVVPMLAKREHIKNLPILWKEIQRVSEVRDKKIDLLVVTVGPGLEPALWTGIQFAQEIHKNYFNETIPLVGVNHLEGHLYSFLLTENKKLKTEDIFPMISLVVSGGHTILGVLESFTKYIKLGETLDDAVGESFDKVARLLDLPYPGGPLIEQLAKEGDAHAIVLPHPMIHQKNYNFSYAGLKTAVLYYLKSQGIVSQNFSPRAVAKKAKISSQLQRDLSASFQEAAFAPLVAKVSRAVQEYGARSVCIGGGVAANKKLPELLENKLEANVSVVVPPFAYCQDNAAMIAVAGYMRYNSKRKPYLLKADGTMNI
ncbi:MAG: tRNA (adenosine(37)-N6)-threonylcarbamoyltransferase complex transferase subunit TsaD [Candidatus Paceibacterota bacterium]